jgi:hypothetical protein
VAEANTVATQGEEEEEDGQQQEQEDECESRSHATIFTCSSVSHREPKSAFLLHKI